MNDVRRDPQEGFTTQEKLDYKGRKEMEKQKQNSLLNKIEMALSLGDKDAIALVMSIMSRTTVCSCTNQEVDLIVKIQNKGYEV